MVLRKMMVRLITDKEVTFGNVDASGNKVVKVTENGVDKWYYTNTKGS